MNAAAAYMMLLMLLLQRVVGAAPVAGTAARRGDRLTTSAGAAGVQCRNHCHASGEHGAHSQQANTLFFKGSSMTTVSNKKESGGGSRAAGGENVCRLFCFVNTVNKKNARGGAAGCGDGVADVMIVCSRQCARALSSHRCRLWP